MKGGHGKTAEILAIRCRMLATLAFVRDARQVQAPRIRGVLVGATGDGIASSATYHLLSGAATHQAQTSRDECFGKLGRGGTQRSTYSARGAACGRASLSFRFINARWP